MLSEHGFENKVSVFRIKGPRSKLYTPFCCGHCGETIRKGKKMPKQYKRTIRDHRRGKSRLKKPA